VELRPVSNRVQRDQPGVYEAKMLSKAPVAVVQGKPPYPFELRRAGVAGEALVDFIIDASGTVRDAVAVRANDVRFGEAAVQTVMKWRFQPAEVNGLPVSCHMQVPIIFSLNQR
jgi:protein TonB